MSVEVIFLQIGKVFSRKLLATATRYKLALATLGNITHIRSSMILSIKTLRIRTNKVTLRIVLTFYLFLLSTVLSLPLH